MGYKAGNEPRAGLETVSIIRGQHPSVPVIIYAETYSAAHENDPSSSPVIAITNDTQRVFTLVTDIATKRGATVNDPFPLQARTT
jgi:hypothetical protein